MSLSPIVVFGANGQVGRALVDLLGSRAIPVTRQEADLSAPETLQPFLDTLGAVAAVINAAAYTKVDKAEDERELASAANSEAPGIMARWCADRNIPFIHYSTDYVFNGQGDNPWREDDPTGPLNHYGATKLEGEKLVAAAGGKYLIFRTSWVYDAQGANFLNTMLRLGAEREALNVVADQFGAPCYAPHLAAATVECLEHAVRMTEFPNGIYHFTNAGETTWHNFAEAIFQRASNLGLPLKIKTVEPIPSSAYPVPAKRPSNSRLNSDKLHKVFGKRLPSWEQGLSEAMEIKSASH